MYKIPTNEINDFQLFISNNLKFSLVDKKIGFDSDESVFLKDLHRVQFEYKVNLLKKSEDDIHILSFLSNLFSEIKVDVLHRVKINVTPPSLAFNEKDLIHTEEFVSGCKTCVVFLTSNPDSGTKVVGGEFYETVKGNYQVFNSYLPHYGIPSKDGRLRCVINIVYTERK